MVKCIVSLGKDQVALIPIAPMTNVERWEAAYTNSQPANGWQNSV